VLWILNPLGHATAARRDTDCYETNDPSRISYRYGNNKHHQQWQENNEIASFWDNWSAKVEYDFYDFSTRNLSLPGTISGIADVVPGG
jgi:hypothetical protein